MLTEIPQNKKVKHLTKIQKIMNFQFLIRSKLIAK